MNIYEERNIKIYINMFVHYPQAYNANAVCNKFNSILKEDCYVMINSAPHSEEESLKIEVCFDKSKIKSVNKEMFALKCKEFIIDYFNNQIKDINIGFVSNK